MSYCAIDFGTSNSAIAIANAQTSPGDGQTAGGVQGGTAAMRLVPLEGGQLTMPTAVFYCTDTDDLPADAIPGPTLDDHLKRCFGRTALQAYVDGYEGRLMRSMKSILGTALVDQTTEVGHGYGVKYLDVITGYLRHLRDVAQKTGSEALDRVIMGRPVFFVDDDVTRDAAAQASLETAARAVGFKEVLFQFEPIAAAFDYEQQAQRESLVLVADIGGGTSDFSVVRVGPERAPRLDRRDDILASHGVHVAGTDFDRQVSLTSVMPPLGYGGFGPSIHGQPPRPVPSRVYFDLTTWHMINTVYQPQRAAELRAMADFYGDARQHQRLMKVVTERLGHALVGRAESAKIAVSQGGDTDIDLQIVEKGLHSPLGEAQVRKALDTDLGRIVACALDTVKQACIQPGDIDALYFTGGSTGLKLLTDQLEAAFPKAQAVRGDRLASVATGLGLHAARVYGKGH